MDGALPRSGHSYFGIVSSAQEAHAILEASKLGLLPRVTRRLTDEERLRFIRAGAVFVWEEEEAGIRRWTDNVKWSPSRVSGAFLTYTEVPSRGEESLIKQSFSSVDANGTKMHLIAYASKSSYTNGALPAAARDPLIQRMLSRRSNGGRDPREHPIAGTSSSSGMLAPPAPPAPPPPEAPRYPLPHPPPLTAGHASQSPPFLPPPGPRPHADFRRSHSSSVDISRAYRPRSASADDRARPLTSASEPRPSSSYDSLSYGSSSTPSLSYRYRQAGPDFRPPSAACRPIILPPIPGPSHPFPFAYDSSSTASSRYPSFMGSPAPSTASAFSIVSTAASTAPSVTTASPFDPYPRHLPPLEDLPLPPLPPNGHSPPQYLHMQGTFLDDYDAAGGEEGGEGPGHGNKRLEAPRQPARSFEDERQLRLLSTGL
ncbi:hypothetical protein JCM11251_005504 [Rhodosporidiobolus azoricus]